MNTTPWKSKDGMEVESWSSGFEKFVGSDSHCSSPQQPSCITSAMQPIANDNFSGVLENDLSSPPRTFRDHPRNDHSPTPWLASETFGEFSKERSCSQSQQQPQDRRLDGNKDFTSNKTLENYKLRLFETDPVTLARRQKQIDYGKNTREYAAYLDQVPKESRLKSQPKTPDKTRKCSRRAFDGDVKLWRLLLHAYEPTDEEKK